MLLTGTENEVEISLAVRAGGNVVQVYGFCFDAPDGKLRIVMELCAHGSLRAYLKALPRDKVRQIRETWGGGNRGVLPDLPPFHRSSSRGRFLVLASLRYHI